MTTDTIEVVIEQALSGKFEDAIDEGRDVPLSDLQAEMIGRAYESENLALYGYYVALLLDGETAERHHAAAELLSMSLNIYPGAYQMAYYHARQAAKLAPDDISYQEYLLFYHNNPEKLMTEEEAQGIAESILAVDPENEVARQIIDS